MRGFDFTRIERQNIYRAMADHIYKDIVLQSAQKSISEGSGIKAEIKDPVCRNPSKDGFKIDLPEFLDHTIEPIVPHLIEENIVPKEFDVKGIFDLASRIIAFGDKPVLAGKVGDFVSYKDWVAGKELTSPGLSNMLGEKLVFRSKYNKNELKENEYTEDAYKDDVYFRMSWLKSHIPVFIVPSALKPESETDTLGCYCKTSTLGNPVIFIFADKIVKQSSKEISVEELAVATIIHEFAHAVMDECWTYSSKSYYYASDTNLPNEDKLKEEGYANALMLRYLERWKDNWLDLVHPSANILYEHAKTFVKSQGDGYDRGVDYMDKENEDYKTPYQWYRDKVDMRKNQSK